MTVHELIEALSKLNPDATVHVEGCDCINPANGEIEVTTPDDVVINAELRPEWMLDDEEDA